MGLCDLCTIREYEENESKSKFNGLLKAGADYLSNENFFKLATTRFLASLVTSFALLTGRHFEAVRLITKPG